MSQKIIYEDGKFIEVTTTESRRQLALMPELIKQQQKPVSLVARKVLKVSTHPADLVVHQTGSRVYIIPLEKILWKQYYTKHNTGPTYVTGINKSFHVPSFQKNGYQTVLGDESGLEIKTVDFFKRGTSCFSAFLLLTFDTYGHPVQPYLFIYHKGELYVPPLPNIYTDGRVCMGQEWDNNKTGPYGTDDASILTYMVQSFSTTVWNNHLVNSVSSDFCGLEDTGGVLFPTHDLYPEVFTKHLVKNAPAFLGPWKPL